MNKKRNAAVLIVIFVFQLLIPIGMIAYTSYIEWGLVNRAAVYRLELVSVEWMHPNNVYLQYAFHTQGTTKGTYCELRTGDEGFADMYISQKRPKGNYIRSNSGRWFYMPVSVTSYELQPHVPLNDDDYRWLYFVPKDKKEEWGWQQTENYFDEAYAEVHIFKGHAITKAVYIDGKTIEEHIADCIRLGIKNE